MRNTLKGTCQVCGSLITIEPSTSLIVEHQYLRTWSLFSGVCTGSHNQPLEQSKDLTHGAIQTVNAKETKLRNRAKDLRENVSPVVLRNGCTGIEPFELTELNEHIWRYETRTRNKLDAIKAYNSQSAYPLEKGTILCDAYVLWQKKRLENWRITELISNKNTDLIKALNRSRTQMIRASKKEAARSANTPLNDHSYGCNYSSTDFDNDFLAQLLRSEISKIKEQRAEVILLAKRAFHRGDTTISYYTFGGGSLVRETVQDIRELQILLDAWASEVPIISCIGCKAHFQFHYGDLWCGCCGDLDFDNRLEAVSLAARAYARGDTVIHVHIYSKDSGEKWYDLQNTYELKHIFDTDQEAIADLICDKCKEQFSFYLGELKCECSPYLIGTMPELASTKEPDMAEFVCKPINLEDFGIHLHEPIEGRLPEDITTFTASIQSALERNQQNNNDTPF